MKMIRDNFGIYFIFMIGGLFITYATYDLILQLSDCLPYDGNYDSIPSKWLNINYFDMRVEFRDCMNGIREYCKLKGFPSCGMPNLKPGIIYGILGILIFYSGIRLRKKYVLNILQ